jgi:glycosyltransferase involved in cell wall biosynthesis
MRLSLIENISLYLSFVFIGSFRNLLNEHFDILNTHDWFTIWVASPKVHDKTKLIALLNDIPERNAGFINCIKLYFDKKYAVNVSSYIVLDRRNKMRLQSWVRGAKDKIDIVRSGVDIAKFKNFIDSRGSKQFFQGKEKHFIFVCANLMAPHRRFEDAIRAFSQLSKQFGNARLLILSKLDFNVSYSNFLLSEVRRLKLEGKVWFVDKYFTDEERMSYIYNSDVLIFPNYPQTWGLTVLEAMALGVSVIVSDGSGVSEILHDGVDSFVYRAGDSNKLAEKMRYCIQHKKEKQHMAILAKKYVLRTFSWQRYAEYIIGIMKRP